MIDARSGASGTHRYSDVAEQEHEDGEDDRGFRSGNGQDEEHEDLARHVAQVAGECDEVEIHGEQHELDRHQHDDHVAAVQENARDADREQDRAQNEVVRQRRRRENRHVLLPFERRTKTRTMC